MSKSIHQTKKSVYGGKSRWEINEMIADGDHDVEQLAKKGLIKNGILDSKGHYVIEEDTNLSGPVSPDAEPQAKNP